MQKTWVTHGESRIFRITLHRPSPKSTWPFRKTSHAPQKNYRWIYLLSFLQVGPQLAWHITEFPCMFIIKDFLINSFHYFIIQIFSKNTPSTSLSLINCIFLYYIVFFLHLNVRFFVFIHKWQDKEKFFKLNF